MLPPNQIKQALAILKKGGSVVYPTDTAYGLAVDATNTKAVKKLYQLKGRDFQKPIHVIFPDVTWLSKLVFLNENVLRLMNRFMPGPITLVLPLKIESESFKLLSSGTNTLGVRLPDHQVALELARKFKKPITTTSANISGADNAYSVAEVKKQFLNIELKPDFYLDAGKLPVRKPSTVVLADGDIIKILREGPISESKILKAIK